MAHRADHGRLLSWNEANIARTITELAGLADTLPGLDLTDSTWQMAPDGGAPAPDRIVLAGFSQGCAMALQTGLRHPQKLAGLLCLSGYVPLHTVIGAERHAANQHTPIFMAHGHGDPVIPIRRAEQSRDLLQLLGYPVEWHTYPMPHSVCPDEINDIGRWLQKLYRRENS